MCIETRCRPAAFMYCNKYPRPIKLLAASSKYYQMARDNCPVVNAGEMLAQF